MAEGEKKPRKPRKKDAAGGAGLQVIGGYVRDERGVIILNEDEDVCSAFKCLRPQGVYRVVCFCLGFVLCNTCTVVVFVLQRRR